MVELFNTEGDQEISVSQDLIDRGYAWYGADAGVLKEPERFPG